MRELKRKADEEMLIVHKQPEQPDPDKSGRARGGPFAAAPGGEELASLGARLRAAADASEKRELLAEIQRRFGNEAAKRVVRDAREMSKTDDGSSPPPRPTPGKGKA